MNDADVGWSSSLCLKSRQGFSMCCVDLSVLTHIFYHDCAIYKCINVYDVP